MKYMQKYTDRDRHNCNFLLSNCLMLRSTRETLRPFKVTGNHLSIVRYMYDVMQTNCYQGRKEIYDNPIEQLADFSYTSIKTVERCLKTLVACKLISVVKKSHRKATSYTVGELVRVNLKIINNHEPLTVIQTPKTPVQTLSLTVTQTVKTSLDRQSDAPIKESFLKDYKRKQREPKQKALSNLIKFKPKAQKAKTHVENYSQHVTRIHEGNKNPIVEKPNSISYWTSVGHGSLVSSSEKGKENRVLVAKNHNEIITQINNFSPTQANKDYAASLGSDCEAQTRTFNEKYSGKKTEAAFKDWLDNDHAYRLKKQTHQTTPSYQKNEIRSTVPFFVPHERPIRTDRTYDIQAAAMDEMRRKLKGTSYDKN